MPDQAPVNDAAERSRPTFRGKPVDVVIDVRSKLEFWLGHLEGAVCIPVGVVGSRVETNEEITMESRILVYCASGARSAAAATQLRSMGYRHVTDGAGMTAAAREYSPEAAPKGRHSENP